MSKKRAKTGTPPKRKARPKRGKAFRTKVIPRSQDGESGEASRTKVIPRSHQPSIVRDDGGPAPEEGGPAEVMVSERASAMPLTPGSRVERSTLGEGASVSAGVAMEGGVEGPLERLQAWFSAVVTHPTSAAEGVESAAPIQRALGAHAVEEIVTPSARMTAVDRLGIYQFAYHARLVECLADDYPAVKTAIGEDTFETVARRYIAKHPSQNANLNSFGSSFAGFVAEQSDWLEHHAFLADLARLEWAMVEVLHAPAAPALLLSGLSQLAPEAWGRIELSPAPTLRFLELDHPANAFLQATRDGESPEIPPPAWSATAVYRQGYTIWRMGFTRPMARVLSALLEGQNLSDALDRLDVADTSEGDVMVWFREWVSGGFFSAIHTA